tara:strand:- start:278 stop:1171 length:894 start_codon:yes stop_codon:yes gene_type:complete
MNLLKMKNENRIPAIAIIPYRSWPTFGLRNISLDNLEWPLGRPRRLQDGKISDLTEIDHIITFPRKHIYFMMRYKVRARISLMIVEPDIIHGHHIKLARFFNWRFYKILSKNKYILKKIKNGIFFYYGSTFLTNINKIDITKKNMASLIASSRDELPGHKLRHSLIKYIKNKNINVAVMGRGYKPFKNKADGLKSFRYSIVIENSSELNYFTEKIIDACLLETVPIYWGSPNISEYFDERGFIICKDLAEIKNALNKISISDYESRMEWIKKNKEVALYHADFTKRAALKLQKSLSY